MRERIALALVLSGLFTCAIGCKKEVGHAELITAINKSFVGRHECVWTEPVKLPAQIDPSKDEKIRSFDALTDAGLLLKGAEEKKRFLVGSKLVNIYDLSDKGHSSWTADASQLGYGNFCFGHFNATAIVQAIPNSSPSPTRYAVKYRYEVEGIPDWIRTPESMRAFPNLASDTSIQSATANLVKDANSGWIVESPNNAH